MNKSQIASSIAGESKTAQSVCAQCGSTLSSTDGTEKFCVNCLLRVALPEKDVDLAQAPRRFDQYELIIGDDGAPIELGRGAMGVTYKAFDRNLRYEVALKVIHPRFLADESSRARFLSEARAAAQLRHRNIASVFHLGDANGEYFYAMELVDGETIEDRVRRNGPIDCATALDITLQITHALIATGSRQFVHRDVKPSNIMLCTEADGAIVAKLIDFGLVRAVIEPRGGGAPAAEPLRRRRRSHTGFIGTPDFASPEQFAGKTTDIRSDIFSLGVTLWFMLTGKLPFAGTREDIRQQQLGSALPLDQLKGVPRAVLDLIKRMLEADPAKRSQSPGALQEQLSKCIAAIDAAKQKQRRRFAYTALAAVVIIAPLATSYILQRKLPPSALSTVVPEKSIAVLPFENLSGDPDNAYFSDGIQEEILTRLTSVAGLKVISRTSTQQYQSKPRNLREIARQLGVANVLEGSVQKAADQVRVNVQLINAQTDSHLWADSYDRKLTDILGVESEIAKRIAESLQAKLTGREEQVLAVKPTNNPEAYDAYLRGLALDVRILTQPRALNSADSYEQAVRLDPSFAVAWARLSRAHATRYLTFNDPVESDAAKRALENVQRLAPNSPEALLALGYYQFSLRDYGLAKTTFERVSEMLPSSTEAPYALGRVARRAGHWDQAVSYFERALSLDPGNIELLKDAAWTYVGIRQFPTALKLLDRVVDITPNDPGTIGMKILIFQAQGNLQEAARLLSGTNPEREGSFVFNEQLRLERNYGEAIRFLQTQLAQLHYDSQDEKGYDRVSLALIQRLAGDTAGAKVAAEQARNMLEPLSRDKPDDLVLTRVLSWTYASMGENDLALKLAERAIMLLPRANDAQIGPAYEENLALIQTMIGENSRAISTLTQLLQMPYLKGFHGGVPITSALLRLDPIWDPLRTDPRFQKLCEEK
jgi:serine/threonine protein kinase